jgi:alanine racemase
VRALAPSSRVLAVIKANAYGHGIVTAARSLADADALAVARVEEALALRQAGVTARVVLLEGVQDARELGLAAAHGLEIFVHHAEQIARLEAWTGQPFFVWLKIDTGMGRLGFRPAEVATASERLARCAAVMQPANLVTHLAEAELRGNPRTRAQIDGFAQATRGLGGERSLANSAGLVAWPDAQAHWVRPGIMLYGISPFADAIGSDLGLRPVMTFETRVIALKEVDAGARVGYGGAWVAKQRSRIAIAAAGYGDGYPRGVANGAPVRVNGMPAAIAGRVSMDMLAIDVSDVLQVAIGDPVQLWGPAVPVERVAAAAGTIGYELICRVSQRVPFVVQAT